MMVIIWQIITNNNIATHVDWLKPFEEEMQRWDSLPKIMVFKWFPKLRLNNLMPFFRFSFPPSFALLNIQRNNVHVFHIDLSFTKCVIYGSSRHNHHQAFWCKITQPSSCDVFFMVVSVYLAMMICNKLHTNRHSIDNWMQRSETI